MTYIRKRRMVKRSKDILLIALKNLFQGEELICTARTYGNIQERIDAFSESRQDRRLAVIVWKDIRKIRRVA